MVEHNSYSFAFLGYFLAVKKNVFESAQTEGSVLGLDAANSTIITAVRTFPTLVSHII